MEKEVIVFGKESASVGSCRVSREARVGTEPGERFAEAVQDTPRLPLKRDLAGYYRLPLPPVQRCSDAKNL